MKENTPLFHYFVCFQMHNKWLQLKSFIIWVRIYFFLKNYVTSEEVISCNVLYYIQLSNARYQVRFYANIQSTPTLQMQDFAPISRKVSSSTSHAHWPHAGGGKPLDKLSQLGPFGRKKFGVGRPRVRFWLIW